MRIFLLIAVFALLTPIYGLEPTDETLNNIRKDHPRLFLTKETLPAVRKRCLTTQKKRFAALLDKVDKYPEKPEFKLNPSRITKSKDGKYHIAKPHYMLAHVLPLGGIQAEQSAFAYLITKNPKYLTKAKNHLLHSIQIYEWALENQLMTEWNYNHCERSIIAYDWLYNDLTDEERKKICTVLLKFVKEQQKDGKATFRRNIGNPESGYYGCERLQFYNGTAFYGDNINDKEAASQFFSGVKGFNKTLEFREKMSGGYGALANMCLYYSFGEYPFSTLRYFLAVKSALGINEADNWKQMRDFPAFVAMNLFPGKERPLEFGLGDAYHQDNSLSFHSMKMTMRSIAFLYPESEDTAAGVHRMLAKYFKSGFDCVADFIVPGIPYKKKRKSLVVPHFAYVPTIGVAYFRSGDSKDDTFACFRAGGISDIHAHYDQNHFVIYKNGFQAVDSGTRGLNQSFHLPYYYAQTVAHNTILIDMPNEKIAPHWGPGHHGYKAVEPLMDGGQYQKLVNAKVKTSAGSDYASILCDATEAYRKEKCKLAEREFIHLQKDMFLVIDRIITTDASFRKRWLLHTQNKITVDGKTFSAEEQDGRLKGIVLYPTDVKMNVIGGKGKEFWTGQRNWELHPKHDIKYTGKLHGNWRIEISPKRAAEFDMFITLLQVSGKNTDIEKIEPTIKKSGKIFTVAFVYSGKKWIITIPEKSGEQSSIKLTPLK